MNLPLELNWLVVKVSMVDFLVGGYINEEEVSLNEQMITEGYDHAYDGGTRT